MIIYSPPMAYLLCFTMLSLLPGYSLAQNAASSGQIAKKQSGITIAQFSPVGTIAPDNIISVTFSGDMVTSQQITSGNLPQSPILFDPNIDGIFEWESTRKVRFSPRVKLPPGTQFSAKINPALKSPNSVSVTGPTEYKFNTSALWLKSAKQSSFTSDKRVIVQLNFSDKVVPAELTKYLSVSVGGRSLSWTPQNDVATAEPKIITSPIHTTDTLTLTIKPGLAGASGPLPIRNQVEISVPLKLVLQVVEITPTWSKDKVALKLRFSGSVNAADVRKMVSVEPKTELTFSGYDNEILLNGDFKPETRYTVKIRDGIRGTNGSILLKPETLSAWVPTMPPFLEVLQAGGYLSNKGGMKLRLNSTGVDSVKVTVRRVFDNNLVYQVMRGGSTYSARELGRKVHETEIPLRFENNKASVSEIDLKKILGENSGGLFSVTVQGKKAKQFENTETEHEYSYYDEEYNVYQLRNTSLITVSDIGLLSKKSGKQVFVWAASLDSAKPLENIRIELYSNSNQLLKEGSTDAFGVAIMEGIETENDTLVPRVILAKSSTGDISFLDIADTFRYREDLETKGRPYLTEGYEAFVSTDRGAYRPGEDVHVFGFLRDHQSKTPLDAFPLESVLINPTGKAGEPTTVFSQEDGTIHFRIKTTSNMPTGYYKTRIQMPGTSTVKGENNND